MALIRYEGGAKVGWEYYDNEQEAREAADRAYSLACRKEKQGFDFGWVVPGTIWQITQSDGTCLWRVTVP